MPRAGADILAETTRVFLLMGGAALLVTAVIMLAVDGFGEARLFGARLGALGVMLAAWVALTQVKWGSRLRVRSLELLLFGGMAAFVAVADLARLLTAAELGGPGLVMNAWNETLLHTVLLMGAYALAVPNAAGRALVVLSGLALVPFGLLLGAGAASAEVSEALAPLRTGGEIAVACAILAIAAAVGTLGSKLIGVFRTLALEAREERLYTLKRMIGSGAMGEVWLAEHGTLKRTSAIKVIRPERLAGSKAAARRVTERFEKEAQATANLRSPNTVEVYNFGVTQQGLFYYVMEFLDGIDLETLVREHGPVPAERAVHLLQQVCQSLADAHTSDLVHRDVKPANIYVARQGLAHDVVKVLDFGLAQPASAPGAAAGAETLSGTPAYLAPETIAGDTPGPSADQYAVGCVAYWLLTGELVFSDKSTVVEMLEAHAQGAPVAPSQRTELPIPEALDAVVLRCLAKDPEARFGSLLELSDVLAEIPLERPWDARRARAWWQRHRPPAAA